MCRSSLALLQPRSSFQVKEQPTTSKDTKEEKRSSTTVSYEDEGSSVSGILPARVIACILKHLVRPREPANQQHLAKLRRVSKLFCRLATPHMYEVIKLSDSQHHMEFIFPMRTQRQLCETTRAIWWGRSHGRVMLNPEPHLCKFPNVEHVAYYTLEPTSVIGAPTGVFFGFRNVGEWCKSVKLPAEFINKQQCTPTLRVNEKPGAPSFPLTEQPKRAIWALQLVVPDLSQDLSAWYGQCKTLTHLSIDVYSHPDIPIVASAASKVLADILDRRTLPLLEAVVIRLIDFGTPLFNMPTQEDIAATKGKHGSKSGLGLVPAHQRDAKTCAAIESREREARSKTLNEVVSYAYDPRAKFEILMRWASRAVPPAWRTSETGRWDSSSSASIRPASQWASDQSGISNSQSEKR